VVTKIFSAHKTTYLFSLHKILFSWHYFAFFQTVSYFQNLSGNMEKISYSTPATPTQLSSHSQQEFLEQLKQQKDRLVKEAEDKRNESTRRSHMKGAVSPVPSSSRPAASPVPSSSRPAASPTTTNVSGMKGAISPTTSSIESREEKAATQQSAAHAYSVAYPSYRASHQLKQDLSFEDDTSIISQTSSTSGNMAVNRHFNHD